jgi:hypothetical protein
MKSLIINLQDDTLAEKVTWMLSHFKQDGLEIIEAEDLEDLKHLSAVRDEKTINWDDAKQSLLSE